MASPDSETQTETSTETETPPDDATQTDTESQEGAEASGEAPPEGEEAQGEGEEGQTHEGEGEGTKEGQEVPPKPNKRGGGFQRKIAQLERERAQLLETVQRLTPPPGTSQPKSQTPEERATAYIQSEVQRGIDAYRAREREQKVISDFVQRTAEVRTKHQDWDEVVASVNLPTDSALGQTLLTSPQGPQIMYQLASNPAELARLSALSPLDAAREVGRLEAKLASGPPSANGKTAKRPPVPPTSVNGSSKSTRDLAELPISEYKRAFRSGRR